MHCEKCKSELRDDDLFCANCGTITEFGKNSTESTKDNAKMDNLNISEAGIYLNDDKHSKFKQITIPSHNFDFMLEITNEEQNEIRSIEIEKGKSGEHKIYVWQDFNKIKVTPPLTIKVLPGNYLIKCTSGKYILTDHSVIKEDTYELDFTKEFQRIKLFRKIIPFSLFIILLISALFILFNYYYPRYEAIVEEEKLWSNALQKNTRQAYQRYIESYDGLVNLYKYQNVSVPGHKHVAFYKIDSLFRVKIANSKAADSESSSLKWGTLKDIEGNVYKTVKIGNQWWMAENLKVKHYKNRRAIPKVTSDREWDFLWRNEKGAYCNYNNYPYNNATYGRLYNWYAVSNSNGLAPEGWHIPTDEEWKQLEIQLGMSHSDADKTDWRGMYEGSKLKDFGKKYWKFPNLANNASGFSALPCGFRSNTFHGIGIFAIFWSVSDAGSKSHAWIRILSNINSNIKREFYRKEMGFSVRCVKDSAVINTKSDNSAMGVKAKSYLPNKNDIIGEYSYIRKSSGLDRVFSLNIKKDNSAFLSEYSIGCLSFRGKWVLNKNKLIVNFTEYVTTSCEEKGETNLKCIFKIKQLSGKDNKKLRLVLLSWLNPLKRGDYKNIDDLKEYGFSYLEK